MGIINELIGAIRDIGTLKDDINNERLSGMNRYSSISRRSMEGIMHFPVVVSRSIDMETLQMVNKALEKQFASFAQTAITMSPFLNMKSDKNAINYLRKFHQNTNTRSNLLDDTINAISVFEAAGEGMVEEYVSESQEGTLYLVATVCEGTAKSVILANKDGLVDIMEGIRMESLNDMYVPKTKYRFKDPHNQAIFGPAKESSQTINQDNRGANMSTKADRIDNNYGDVRINITGSAANVPGMGALGAGGSRIEHQLPNNVLKDNDVKKANELVPTSMHLRVILVDSEGRTAGNMDFIAGVKATMHPVNSDEIVQNITDSIRRGGKLFKTLRWTSGEIGFAKDYILNLTEIKDDATRQTRGNSQWWTALKHRAKLAKLKKIAFLQNDLLPNASIVVSIEEAEHMKLKYGIDVLNPKVAYKLMKEYFLISFVVVDSAKGIVHFLFDGQVDYQDVTFTGLERGDIAGRGVDFKDVMKLVQRV